MKGFRTLPKDFKKITESANKMIEDYLAFMKPILPKPLWAKERTKLMNLCRDQKLTAKNLTGFLSIVKQNTEINPNLEK